MSSAIEALSGAAATSIQAEIGPEFRLRDVAVRPMRSPRKFELECGLIVGVEERPELCGRPEIRNRIESLQG